MEGVPTILCRITWFAPWVSTEDLHFPYELWWVMVTKLNIINFARESLFRCKTKPSQLIFTYYHFAEQM